jgi:protoporphyrinogen oxidase
MNTVILGAGPTGLGAAYRLNEEARTDWQLFESSSHVGGLSASFVDDQGFTWDIGGHVLFSHYPYFDAAVEQALSGAYYEHQRESWVRIQGGWVPYPFQNNVRYLLETSRDLCVNGLRRLAGDPAQAANFREWMDAVFGEGIVRYFMEPYNRKVWGVPLESMSKDWIAERVSVVDLARIERNIAEQRDDLSWGPNNTFKFPQHGGTGAIYSGIAGNFADRIAFNHEMVAIDPLAKRITFSNGIVKSYDILINTPPLDLLVSKIAGAPEEVESAAAKLVHNSGLIVGLGLRGRRDDTKCWMYFPEDNCPFYRVTNFHNYSPYNVPGGRVDQYFSLMCETTYSAHKPVDKETIVEDTIQGLINAGMIEERQRQDIVSTYVIDIPYSYPVPTLERDAALQVIQPWLEARGIYSRGRFGAWKYEVGNMDHSFMQGVEVIERILAGTPERTVHGQV